MSEAEYGALARALGTGEIDFNDVPPSRLDNGVRWLAIRLASPETCIGLKIDGAALSRVVQRAQHAPARPLIRPLPGAGPVPPCTRTRRPARARGLVRPRAR
ncbi:hypothetical protein Busp01_51890 [Trinickia caryophylli]|nr:hypothetical protein Busp01_51890 [Trinickia caryophylli]